MTIAVLVLGLVVGLVGGAAAGWIAAQRRAATALAQAAETARQQASAAQHAADVARQEAVSRVEAVCGAEHQAALADVRRAAAEARSGIESDLAAARADIAQLQSRIRDLLTQHQEFLDAQRTERTERELREAGHTQVLKTLAPVAQQLEAMQEKVADMEKQRSQQHGQLAEQILHTKASVEESRKAAEALAAALSNNAVRGTWGETQLKILVETAGLLPRVDFDTQHSINAESGARRPDMVINLPGSKQMAIDAKVPFSSYWAAQRTDLDPAERRRLLGEHAKKVRGHVDELASKCYWSGLTASPEFTIAFIPNDQLLAAALDTDASLMEHAFKQGVILATPTNLWGLLKTVAYTWKQDVLTEDAKVLFDLGRELYSRIVKLAEHAEKLRRSLEATVKSYNAFAGSLESRVLVTARKLDQFDESTLVSSPQQIERAPQALTSGDFAALGDIEPVQADYVLAGNTPTDAVVPPQFNR